MKDSYRTFFGFAKEPFAADIGLKEILQTPDLIGVRDRFDYAVRLGAVAVITGEIGSGKSTALRYALGQLHPSEYQWFYITLPAHRVPYSNCTGKFFRYWEPGSPVTHGRSCSGASAKT